MEDRPGQRFPSANTGTITMNVPLGVLRSTLCEQDGDGYSYQVQTVRPDQGRYMQTGSAPNFQGGVVTLCTCKHRMRGYKEVEEWPGQWIAGFTSVGRDRWDRHYLVYLMRVGHAFPSHADLWEWLRHRGGREEKAADRNMFGDVYRPLPGMHDAGDWNQYYPPVDGHVHGAGNAWHKDIHNQKVLDQLHRVPALLVEDRDYSFLWSRPQIYVPGTLGRTQKFSLSRLLTGLHEHAAI